MTDPGTGAGIERRALALFEAMLDVPEAAREAWIAERTASDRALAERLHAMREADRLAHIRTGAAFDQFDDEIAPERIGAYRITGLIGRGGMGSVYRGERATGDFAHVVAIKIVKPGLLSERLVARFVQERQTLAGLAHPNIAQLHDGGATEAGAPYIVMEFVDGVPLLDWTATHRPGRDARRRLFRQICAAVAFAHRNLIVHRDLTPSNVLVTREGNAKLIDFGIARPSDEAEDHTPRVSGAAPSLASLSLTPGYAAPERLASGRVTTAADIYSLGRLLKRLIPPAADGTADRDLAAIVARATATDPLARYATADALGEDVDAWANGFPVAAARRGRGDAIAKFVRRHRPGVAAAATALVLLIAALGLALAANVRAERARHDAERRFQQTRALAKTLLFDTYDEVSRAPGSTKARALLARTGLGYLDALAADARAPLDVRVEAGRGYTRLAEVTGGGMESQLGRAIDGAALLARAEAILAPAHAAHPDDPAVTRAYAALLLERAGTSLHNDNDPPRARAQAIQAARLAAPLAVRDAETARVLLRAIMTEADSHGWNDDYAPARAAHLRVEQAQRALPPRVRDDSRVLGVVAGNLRLLGEAQHKLHDEPGARVTLDRAVALDRRLLALAPDDPAAHRRLIAALWYRAVVHRSNERDEAARASIAEAVARATAQAARDPADAGALKLVALTGEVYAQVLADLRRYPESNVMGERVTAAHRGMVRLAGGAPGAVRSMTAALATRGGNYYNGGYYGEACGVWREAMANFAALERRGELTETDRRNGYPELKSYVARACDGGPPRAGLGVSI